MTTFRDPSGDAKVGTIDGVCETCGSWRRRMGWSNYPGSYWLMCTASNLDATGSKYGGCDLPTLDKAQRRLALKANR